MLQIYSLRFGLPFDLVFIYCELKYISADENCYIVNQITDVTVREVRDYFFLLRFSLNLHYDHTKDTFEYKRVRKLRSPGM